MKRLMLLLGVFLMGMPLLRAQSGTPTKKVAILEVVDRDDAINYGVRLLLRTTLAKAITQTPGYEGYDRVDMGAIQGEQDFQRTGMVSDEQIKRLGEMTGAAYVLVAEAAKIDATNMIVTAKILDVETAKLERTDYEQMGISAKEMAAGCQKMANRLLNVSSQYRGTMESNYEDSKKANETRLTPSTDVVFKGLNLWKDFGRTKLSQSEAQGYLGNYYGEYLRFVKNKKAGMVLTYVGGAVVAIGCGLSEIPAVGLSMLGAGSVCLAAGIPLWVIANKKVHGMMIDFESRNRISYQSKPVLSIESGQYGIGLSLHF